MMKIKLVVMMVIVGDYLKDIIQEINIAAFVQVIIMNKNA